MKRFTFRQAAGWLGITILFLVVTYFWMQKRSGGDIGFAFLNAAFSLLINLLLLHRIFRIENRKSLVGVVIVNVLMVWMLIAAILAQ